MPMPFLLKTLLALALALGFLALDARAQADPAAAPAASAPVSTESIARPTVAFLGLDDAADPTAGKAIGEAIRRELAADTSVRSIPEERIELAFGKGILRNSQAGPSDAANLARVVGARYYGFGRLERISVGSKRVWWKPWSVKVQWDQAMRLRVIDSAKGEVVFNDRVSAVVTEKAFFTGPEENWSRMSPLDREKHLRVMAGAVSEVSARAISKAVKDREAAGGSAAAAMPSTSP